jgi:hypothetical protein
MDRQFSLSTLSHEGYGWHYRRPEFRFWVPIRGFSLSMFAESCKRAELWFRVIRRAF